MTDGDLSLAVALEARNVGGHTIVEPDPALLDEHHDARRRRDDLGERRQIENRVERHRFGSRHERPIPDRLLVQNPIASPDEDDGAGEFLVRDRFPDERLDCVEPPDVDGHLTFGWPGRG